MQQQHHQPTPSWHASRHAVLSATSAAYVLNLPPSAFGPSALGPTVSVTAVADNFESSSGWSADDADDASSVDMVSLSRATATEAERLSSKLDESPVAAHVHAMAAMAHATADALSEQRWADSVRCCRMVLESLAFVVVSPYLSTTDVQMVHVLHIFASRIYAFASAAAAA